MVTTCLGINYLPPPMGLPSPIVHDDSQTCQHFCAQHHIRAEFSNQSGDVDSAEKNIVTSTVFEELLTITNKSPKINNTPQKML